MVTFAALPTRTAVKTANYTAAPDNLVPVDTATPNANVTVTLPTAPPTNTRITVKHIAVGSGKSAIIACGAGDFFNKASGPTSISLTLLNQSVTVQYDAPTKVWTALQDDISVLNAAYAALSATGKEQLAAQGSATMRPWRTALANQAYARANVVLIGDSVTEGEGSTVWTRRLPNRLAAGLRAKAGLPKGGSGFIAGDLTGSTTFTLPVTGSGGTTQDQYSPKRRATVMSASGDKRVWTVTGTSVDLMFTRGPALGILYYKIDGGASVTLDTSGTLADGTLQRLTLGLSGTHTVEVGYSSGGQVQVDGLIVYDGDETSGIQVYDCGHYGYTAASWVSSVVTQGFPMAVAALNPHVIVIELGVNDMSTNVVPATFQTNLTTLISTLRAALSAPLPPIVLHAVAGRATNTGATYPWSQYVAAMYAIAATDSGVTVYDETLRLDSPANDSAYGLYVTNDVHPTDKGYATLAGNLVDFLAPGAAVAPTDPSSLSAPASWGKFRTPAVVGGYYSGVFAKETRTLAPSTGECYLSPCYTDTTITIDSLGVSVSAGVASAVVRAGIYLPASQAAPFALSAMSLVGEVSATMDASTSGVKSQTFANPVVIQPGWFFVAGVQQGAAATLTVNGNAGAVGFSPLGSSTGTHGVTGQPKLALHVGSVTAALPASLTPTDYQATDAGITYHRSA